jgi:hypothetical protein
VEVAPFGTIAGKEIEAIRTLAQDGRRHEAEW